LIVNGTSLGLGSMGSTGEYLQVFMTTSSKEEAEKIARKLVEERLAACIQIIGPIKSYYWWKGAIEESEEWLCIVKTKMHLYEKLESMIKSMHSYQVPEIVVLPIIKGNESYLKWMDEELGKD